MSRSRLESLRLNQVHNAPLKILLYRELFKISVKLGVTMFYLVHFVENNLVKTTFGEKFPEENEIFGEGEILIPGNGLE